MTGSQDYLWIGLSVGFFLGSYVTYLYCKRELKSEIREKYIQLSMAQAHIESLEKTLQQGTGQQSMAPASLQNPQKRKALGRPDTDDQPITLAQLSRLENISENDLPLRKGDILSSP